MTNYHLPETDRIAADVNPVLDEIASADAKTAAAIEVGAITVIGLLGESAQDLREKTIAQAKAAGLPEEAATEPFDVVFSSLQDALQPRLDAMRDAVMVAQGVPTNPIEALLNGLVEAMLGDDEADEDEDEAQTYTDGSEPQEVTDEDMEREFTEFLNALFNGQSR